MLHGVLVVNKERGVTSHQVVADLRRILKQAEIGHTGTLDPGATGVLVVGLGQATRFFPFFNENIKVYQAEIIFGQATNTQDASGEILSENTDFLISPDDLAQAMGGMVGEIDQIPPMFSAVKVKGRKLYELARRGLEIERDSRKIKVYHWNIIDPQKSYRFKSAVSTQITCSKGTYVRTLIHDLGEALGCGAHMGSLTRLKSGVFTLEEAATVTQIKEYYSQGRLDALLLSLNTALSHLQPIWALEEDLSKLAHGGKLSFEKYPCQSPPGTMSRILDRISRVMAVAELRDAGSYLYWQPVKVFQDTK